MNKRLADDGVEGVDLDVLQNKREQSTADNEPSVTDKAEGTTATFDKVHQDAFDKMESIVQYAQKRARAPEPILSKKRKSSLVIKERAAGEPRRHVSGLRVASGASRVKVVPGGFGEEDDEEEDMGQRRMSKRPRLERETLGKSVEEASGSNAPAPPNGADKDSEEGEKKQKERELIRKRLEYNKAKRRSSMGRPSLGRAPPPRELRYSKITIHTNEPFLQKNRNRHHDLGSYPPPNRSCRAFGTVALAPRHRPAHWLQRWRLAKKR